MIEKEELSIIFFINLIVTEKYKDFNYLQKYNPRKAKIWEDMYSQLKSKSLSLYNDNTFNLETSYKKYAKYYPEFGKIISISFAYIRNETVNDKVVFGTHFKTLVDSNNSEYNNILLPSAKTLDVIYDSNKKIRLCGYKLNKFIYKYIIKKYLMYDIKIPAILEFWKKKPWENQNIDLYNMLNIYTYDNITPYELILQSMNIDLIDIDWDNINNIYYNERDFNKIKLYNEEFLKSEIKLCHKMSKSEIPLNI